MGSMGKEDCSVRGHLRLFTILTISAFFGEGVGFETGVGAMRLAATSIFACLGGVGLGYTAPTPPQRRCLYSSRFSFRFAGGVKVGVVVERVGGAIGFAAHTDNAASLSCFRSERFFPPNPRPVHWVFFTDGCLLLIDSVAFFVVALVSLDKEGLPTLRLRKSHCFLLGTRQIFLCFGLFDAGTASWWFPSCSGLFCFEYDSYCYKEFLN